VSARVLVAGIGNVFLGDDAFGCAVAQHLARRPQGEGVRVRDFGTRGLDLACELAAGWDAAILIDAAPRGAAPGTLCVLDPRVDTAVPAADGHAVRLHQVLPLARQFGGLPGTLRLVGCEPGSLEGGDAGVGLSPAVAAAVGAVGLVESLLLQLREPGHA
jgi:hydrogenase maturation protease